MEDGMANSISDKGIDAIKLFEGLRTVAYRCSAGVWTIGYGHTRNVKAGDRITIKDARALLNSDVGECERSVRDRVEVELTQGMFDALCSFVFNFGDAKFSKSTLLKYLNDEEYELAAMEFDRWVFSDGVRSEGLVRRREHEKKMFLG